jgi:hypothetical protein
VYSREADSAPWRLPISLGRHKYHVCCPEMAIVSQRTEFPRTRRATRICRSSTASQWSRIAHFAGKNWSKNGLHLVIFPLSLHNVCKRACSRSSDCSLVGCGKPRGKALLSIVFLNQAQQPSDRPTVEIVQNTWTGNWLFSKSTPENKECARKPRPIMNLDGENFIAQ